MPHYPYTIIGGGMAAAAAVKGIRSVDQDGAIAVFSKESDPPYARPPLTKGLWKDKSEEEIWFDMNYPHLELFAGNPIQRIHHDNRIVIDAQGETYSYDRLLLATGGQPQRLPFGGDHILYYRTLRDYQRLRTALTDRSRVTVIGAGFIGQELSASLAMNGHDVTLIFPEDGIGARLYPPDLASSLMEFYRQKGVQVLSGETVTGVEQKGNEKLLQTKSGQAIPSDLVVAGIGIRPNLDLAQAAGLKVEDGVIVNQTLQTSQPNIYAAGDIAEFYSPLLRMRLRLEHEDAATSMGETAGRNMAGENVTFDYLPFFYSDMFELGYEAVGRVNSKLETFADWEEPYQKGIIYYLDEGRVQGVLLFNVWDKVDQARALMAEEGPFDANNLRGKISL
jgi:3-phenylpropionate/trans-cinnamate dioxygenase ferredoxin reductase component